MQRYKSKYTGSQMDAAFERALPGGEIDQLRPNRNLLNNWDFRSPVNQRGQTSYAANDYCIDRWIRFSDFAGSLVNISSNGILFPPYTGVAQKFEKAIDNTKTYTASAMIDGSVESAHCVFGSYVSLGNASVYIDTNSCYVKAGVPTVTIQSVKLELGSVSTLANDPPADYGAELTRCKRYFNLWASEAARTAALLEVGAMRTTPALSTLTISGTTYYTASADL